MKKYFVLFLILIFSVNLAYAERVYTYTRTVGPEAGKYDFTTINDAIADMQTCELSPGQLGCIFVYPGTYIEQINSFYPGGHDLPEHCDLIGKGKLPSDVVIQHKRRSTSDPNFVDIVSEIYADGLLCDGDNVVENIKVHNVGENQNSVEFIGEGTFRNCIIVSQHNALTARKHLIVKNCNIEGMYLPCIQPYSTFEISDCNIYPKTRTWGGEHPSGIQAWHSGTINNVSIRADIASSDYEPHYDTPWLAGVILQLTNTNETVTINNVSMDLKLTTLYHDNRPEETADWELFGIVSGGRNPKPTTYYPGHAIVKDCQINLTGIEDSSNPNGDGRAIMVAGVCVQGGGRVDVIGDTTIRTSRKAASFGDEGYEYSLNNQNGIITVDFNTVDFDKTITNGVITAYDPNEFNEPNEPNEPNDPNIPTESTEPQESNIPDLLFRPRNDPPPLLLQCPESSIRPYRLEEFDYPSVMSEKNFEASGFMSLDGSGYTELQEITSSQFLDPNVTYYVPYPPLLIHGVSGEKIDVVIPSGTTIVLTENWDYGIVIYNGANVYFGEPTPDSNEPNDIQPPGDTNNPVEPVWVVGESGNPFFNNYCGILVDRTAGTRCLLNNIYLSGFQFGIIADQQLEYPVSNIYSFGCYNGIFSFGSNKIMNSYVSYFGVWSYDWQYYGQAYCFIPESFDGSIAFVKADFEIYNCLADDGDDGFTVYGVSDEPNTPNFYSRDCVATNCYSGFNGWNYYVAFSIICPGLYNNYQNKNFPDMPFTDPVYETNDPFVVVQNDYRLFLDPNSQFVDHGSSLSVFPGWTTRIDGKPDEGVGDIWPHYQTTKMDMYPTANLNWDNIVDMLDLAEFADQWLAPAPVSADFDNDGTANFVDFAVLAGEWMSNDMSVKILDLETQADIDPNNVHGHVGVYLEDIPLYGGIISIYVDNLLIGDLWLGWDNENNWVGLESDIFSNGWHTIRVVTTDFWGNIINHKPVKVYFNNLLYKVTANDHFHPTEDYKYNGFYDGSNTLDAQVANQDGQVIWSNTYSGPYVSITVPGATFGSEQFCQLTITETESLMMGGESTTSSSTVNQKTLQKSSSNQTGLMVLEW
jgi:hypothetical protein